MEHLRNESEKEIRRLKDEAAARLFEKTGDRISFIASSLHIVISSPLQSSQPLHLSQQVVAYPSPSSVMTSTPLNAHLHIIITITSITTLTEENRIIKASSDADRLLKDRLSMELDQQRKNEEAICAQLREKIEFLNGTLESLKTAAREQVIFWILSCHIPSPYTPLYTTHTLLHNLLYILMGAVKTAAREQIWIDLFT